MPKSTIQIIYSIKSKIKPRLSDDTILPEDEWILHKVNDIRATLIRSEYQSKKYLDDLFYQSRRCIEIVCGKVACGGVFSGDIDYYSQLPHLLGGIDWLNIKYLGDVNFKNPYERKNLTGWQNQEGNLWTGDKPVYTLLDGVNGLGNGPQVLFKNIPKGIKYIGVIAIFSGPTEPCDSNLEMDYPLTDDLIYQLELIVTKDILSTYGLPVDTQNDARSVEENLSDQERQRANQINKNNG